MELNKAREYYCNKTRVTREAVRRISMWDETKTIKENAERLGVLNQTAQKLCIRYNLKFKNINPHRGVLRRNACALLRAQGWTLEEIATAFHVSKQNIDTILQNRANDRPLGRPIKPLK